MRHTATVASAASRAGWWSLLALVAAVGAGFAFAYGPLVSTCTTTAERAEGCSNGVSSFVATEGDGMLVVGMVPAAIAVVPLLRRSPRTLRVTAIVLSLIFFVTGPYGVLLIPALVPAWIAVVASEGSS